MTKKSNAVESLISAQKNCDKVVKNSVNPFHKSKYADLQSVLDACKSALHDNGFAVLQTVGKDEHGSFVETKLQHFDDAAFSSKVYLSLSKTDMQALGSAITYARRYGLISLMGLAPEDDDGNATVQTSSPKIKSQPPQQQVNGGL
jgi:hypothetical protein